MSANPCRERPKKLIHNSSTLLACLAAAVALEGRVVAAGEPQLPGSATVPAASPAPGAQGAGTYLILYADQLKDAAESWADYRRAGGWTVVLHAVKPGEPAEDQANQRIELQRWIRQVHAERAQQSGSAALQFDVLILGDVPQQGTGGVPTWHFAQTEPTIRDKTDPEYATDDPYQLLDDADELPDAALGRVPARTSAEALAVLDKVKRYEANNEPGQWRGRICFAAGEGHFGPSDALLEQLFKQMVDQFVPAEFDVNMTYAKATSVYCPPPSQLTKTVVAEFGEGSLLVNYLGHGHATGLDQLYWGTKRVPILRCEDVATLDGGEKAKPGVGANPEGGSPGAANPIALLTCCSAGWFDSPAKRCLAEELLFNPEGPIAVIAGSRPTHPYCNGILQKDVMNLLLIDRVSTIGALDLAAMRSMIEIDAFDRQLDAMTAPIAAMGKWQTSLTNLRRMHARIYNLLGDPATRIARPVGSISDLAMDGNVLSGRTGGIVTGRVSVSIETELGTMARASDVQPVRDGSDPDLETKAAHNYALANDRVLRRLEGAIADGQFRIALGEEMPEGAAVVKVYAVGTNAQGRAIDALGAMRLPRREAPPQEGIESDR